MPGVQLRVGASIDSSLAAALQPVLAQAKRARQVVQSEAEAASKAQANAAEKAAAAQEKAVARALAAAEKATARGTAAAEKAAARETAVAEKAAQAKVRADLRAFDQRIKASQRAADAEERDIMRVAAAAERAAQRRAAAERRAAEQVARSTSRSEGRAALNVGRDAYRTFGGVAGRAGRLGLGIARGAGANLDIGSAVGNVVRQQQIASQVVNSGYLEGASGAAGVRQNATEVHHEARAAALGAGISTDQALEGLQAFVGKSTDLETGRAILGDLAKLSKATGANMVDVAEAAGEVANKLGDVPNKGEAVKDLMATIAQQGKLGAVEMRDMATNLATVIASAGKFGGDTAQATKDLGAVFQVTKKYGGAKNASQAATSVQSFVAGLTNPAELKRLDAQGINVFADKGKTKINPIGEIIAASLFKSGGDLSKLGGMFRNQRAQSVVTGFGQIYNQAGGGEEGVAAVKKAMETFGKAMSSDDIQGALKEAMGTTASKTEQFNTRLEEVAEKLAGAVLPAFEKLEPLVLKAADGLARLVEFTVDNPGEAIMAAIAVSIGKAAIGESVKDTIVSLIKGGGGGGPGGGGGGGGGGVVGGALTGVALGVAGGVAVQEQEDAIVDRAGGAQNRIQGDLKKIRHARNNHEVENPQEVQIQGVAATATQLNERVRNAEESEGITGLYNVIRGNISHAEYDQGREDLKHLPEMKAALDQQLLKLDNLTTATLKVAIVSMPTVPRADEGYDTGKPHE